MANRYWVGNGGNWSDTAHWSATDGGASGASEPTAADNAYFTANSFSSGSQTITISNAATCLDLDFTGVTNTPTLAFANSLTVAGSLTFVAGMAISGTQTINMTSNGSVTIDLGTKTFPNTFQCIGGGTYTLTSAATFGALALSGGTFTTGNFDLNYSSFSSSGTRTINLGSSTLTGASAPDFSSSPSTLTLNAGTSTIVVTGNNVTFAGQGKTFYNVTFQGATSTISGNNTFNSISCSTGVTLKITAGSTQTISSLSLKEITLTSTSTSTYTISVAAGSVSLFGCTISYGVFTGGATFTAYRCVITSSTGLTDSNYIYWIAGTGNISDSTNWAYLSGSTQDNLTIVSRDNLVFDANSFGSTSLTTTVDSDISCNSINFTGALNVPTLAGSAGITCSSSLTLISGMNITYTGTITFSTSASFETAGKTLLSSIDLTGVTITGGLVIGSTAATVQNFNSSSLQTTVDGITIPGDNTIGTFTCTKDTKFTGSNTFTSIVLTT